MTPQKDTFTLRILRGLALKCPACGQASLYKSFLKVQDSCTCCEQALSLYPADDAPPYLTIFIIAHLVVPFFLYIDHVYDLSFPILLLISLPTTTLLMLACMPSIKGAIVGVLYQLERRDKSPEKPL